MPEKRKAYPLLSFFSNLKILQMYQLLKTRPSNVAAIINAINCSMLYAGRPINESQKQTITTVSIKLIIIVLYEFNQSFYIIGSRVPTGKCI